MPSLSNIQQTAVVLGAPVTGAAKIRCGVMIKADAKNPGTVSIGYSNGVKAILADTSVTTNDAGAGMPILSAPEGYWVSADKLPNRVVSDIWVISDTGNNRVYFEVH